MRTDRDKETKRQRDEVIGQPRTSSLRLSVSSSLSRAVAFTLTEVLIVIALIVLMLALALPAFNFITGGKSIDGAYNIIGSFLARARTEAVGVQEIRGVMFYVDPKTERQMMVLVKETPAKTTDVAGVTYMDAEDADHIPLPKGVGIQLLADGAAGNQDGYIGFNYFGTNNTVQVGGMILFDGNGRLSYSNYGFRMTDTAGTATVMSNLIHPFSPPAPVDFVPASTPLPVGAVGFVLFDSGLVKDKFGDYLPDSPFKTPTVAYSSDTAEQSEEKWYAENATPVLINRYNGTLVKGD